MEGHYSGSLPATFHTVTDPRQAALLTAPKWQPFLARSSSVQAAARQVGCDVNAMLYRVNRLRDAGLLEVVATRPRHGRPVKIYRTPHDAYFVPYSAAPYADLEESLRTQFEARAQLFARLLARRLHHAGSVGQRIYRTDLGEVWREGAQDLASRIDLTEIRGAPHLDVSTTYYLPRDVAADFQQDLARLLLRLRPYARPGEHPAYELTLMFTRGETDKPSTS